MNIILRPTFVRSVPLLLRRQYSTTEEIRQKAKLLVLRKGDPDSDTVAVGKLREDQHSVAICRLDFIKIEDVLAMTPEQLNDVVVVPKTEKVSSSQRLEKLESAVEKLTKQVEELTNRQNPAKPTKL
eukprot:Phypoly_transcript_25570.p1 GENE.Phypoly_transcript_25570~~Phypoly_transcript_25570.p1  ORF type:complete len:127 (+),score=25.37 Phypoly_transcript_25570:95-475(+)